MKLIIINGPNLNLIGRREKNIYGEISFEAFLSNVRNKFSAHTQIDFFHSNFENELIDKVQQCTNFNGLIINPGAFTHYSLAIYDALKFLEIPKVEVHISQLSHRESFRMISVTASACDAFISGMGLQGYEMAIRYIIDKNQNR